jgi:ABC-type multidrug transport system ATPase subunit
VAVQLELQSVSKSFGATRVLQDFSLLLNEGDCVALLGANGSGKSTVIKLLSGQNDPSRGVARALGLPEGSWPQCVSLTAPYTELFEEFTPREHLRWHEKFQPLRVSAADALAHLDLPESAWDRPIKSFSSGMKQRVKLAAAILANTPILLLDEPFSNLDAAGRHWAAQLVRNHCGALAPWGARILVVATNNDPDERALTSRDVPLPKF